MGRKDENNLATIIKILTKFIGRFLYLLGYPFYLLLETLILLTLALFYQVGQLILTRIPFLILLVTLGTKLIFLRLRYYLSRFTRRPRIIPPLVFFEKVIKRVENLPSVIHTLTLRAKAKLPTKPKSPLLSTRNKLIGAGLVAGAALIFSFWFLIFKDLPNPKDLVNKPRPLTTHILDRNSQVLYKIYRSQNRTKLTLDEIPIHIQQATIAIEDAEFYSHPGFSIRGIFRALERNLLRGKLSGGSTITQQLVKNALLTPEKTLRRKIKEIVLAMWTEASFSKDQILEMYLNEVSYGGTAYGIEEAAQLYFGKESKEINLAEAALLAGLPASPTRFSPFGASPGLAKTRQQLVLARMAEEGFISSQQAKGVADYPLKFAPQHIEIKAAHFVMWVKQILVDRYGERIVEEGGLEVVTSLDLEAQEKAQEIVTREVNRLTSLRVGNGAALVTNPRTGEVLAMVGSKNYFDPKEGSFNVTTASRQPGSAIKPVNYSFALSNGYTPATIISDSPVSYNIPGQPVYSPQNYDRKFRGNVPLRVALGSSLNVPAVKVLASYGVEKMIEQGKKMGITTWNQPGRFGLSLTLGGGEIKMTDMAIMYGILANYGKRVELNPILRVKDSTGKVLEEEGCDKKFQISNSKFQIPKAHASMLMEGGCKEEEVLDPRIAFLLTDILRDNSARTPAFGPNSLLVIPGHNEVAVKTGTTQNLRDNWAIGYTKDYVVLAWVGNNDNKPMSYVASGITGATPIWHQIMQESLKDKPNHSWEAPAGVVKSAICPITGTLPCEGCPSREEWFLEENQPKSNCNFKPILEEIEKETEGQSLSEEEKRNRLLEKLRQRR